MKVTEIKYKGKTIDPNNMIFVWSELDENTQEIVEHRGNLDSMFNHCYACGQDEGYNDGYHEGWKDGYNEGLQKKYQE